MWFDRKEHPAPLDRLILVTHGIIWRYEKEPRVDWKGKPYFWGPEAYHVRKELGGVQLAYWIPPCDPAAKGVSKLEKTGYWAVFGSRSSSSPVQNFTYWAHFQNPLIVDDPQGSLSVVVPSISELPLYQPSEEELKARKQMSMLGF